MGCTKAVVFGEKGDKFTVVEGLWTWQGLLIVPLILE